MPWIYVCAAPALLWLIVLLLPWRPWSIRESLDGLHGAAADLSDVTALIPARNEAATIAETLLALHAQGRDLKIVVIDDQSHDGTAHIARHCGAGNVTVQHGAPLPAGWTGKMWALAQGRPHADRPLALLLDADIALAPGTVAALRSKMTTGGVPFVSLMAAPAPRGVWEGLLLPAYIYFFRLLYPFRLANSSFRGVAAAAGGCILLETRLLDEIGGFAALRDELIDDCALARRVKQAGYRTWIGLTHSATMQRRQRLADIWNMVARTAFTQLHYSPLWLSLCTVLMVAAFVIPVLGLALAPLPGKALAAAAYTAMAATYLPTLRYYGLSPAWALTLPVIGALYLAMTWTSALRYWNGRRSQWKDRSYAPVSESNAQD